MKQIVDYVVSFLTISLVLVGIGGVFYNMFRDGGWVSSVFGKFIDLQMENPVVAIPVTIAVVVIGKMWRDRQVEHGKTSKMPDIFVYVIMAAGLFYVWRFYETGSF